MPRCPVCNILMDHVTYEGVPVHNCGTCGGYWVPRIGLRMILARREVTMPEAVGEKMLDLAQTSDTPRELRCPTCERPMAKKLFDERAGPRLDFCRPCDAVWLDRAELEACQIKWEEAHPAPAAGSGQPRSAPLAVERTPPPAGEHASRPDRPPAHVSSKDQDRRSRYIETSPEPVPETDATGIPIKSEAARRRRIAVLVLLILAVAGVAAYIYLFSHSIPSPS
jgi:Zn-finger nucleic acid-binding protein